MRVNNGVRRAIEAAMGALGVGNRRSAAAHRRRARRLQQSQRQGAAPSSTRNSPRKPTPAPRRRWKQARAAIFAAIADASTPDALRAIAALGDARRQDGEELHRRASPPSATIPRSAKRADAAHRRASTRSLLLWGVAQNGWYGLSASSVLLLAAIGLAITFGVMGVINMAHGEMVMLGAYSTYVVQTLLPPSMANWSLAAGAARSPSSSPALAGVVIERLVVRYLYTRPLETLLATWGVSLILQQAVRTIFGASNRQVYSPPFLSGAFHLGGLAITYNRLWIIVLAGVVFVGAAVRAARDLVRPADARGDAEPAHGVGDGHLDARRSTCWPSRSARASRASPASR